MGVSSVLASSAFLERICWASEIFPELLLGRVVATKQSVSTGGAKIGITEAVCSPVVFLRMLQ